MMVADLEAWAKTVPSAMIAELEAWATTPEGRMWIDITDTIISGHHSSQWNEEREQFKAEDPRFNLLCIMAAKLRCLRHQEDEETP